MAKMKEAPGDMMLTKGYTQEKVAIKRLEVEDSQRTIIVRISPSGEQQTEYEHKLGQTRGFARGMSGSHLTRSEARKAYKTVYVPMIAYSLGVTTLSETKLNKLQSIAEEAYLPKKV